MPFHARVTRKALLAAALQGTLAATTSSAAVAQDAAPRQRARRSLASRTGLEASADLVPFIDAHVHLNDEAMQLALMERFGATQAVVFWGRNGDNDSIAAAALRHPDRFIAFVSVSPERRAYREEWERGDPGLLHTLDRLLATGRFRGIGEISAVHFPSPGLPETDFDPAGSAMRGILDLARRHRVPVMVHVEVTRIRELSRLLADYRDVPVIWAHGGYTPLFLARRMLEQHSNLHYELSARTWPRHPRSPDYTILRDGEAVWQQWLDLIEEQSARFVVGTDTSHRSPDSDAIKYASVQSFLRQLRPAARERVARANLASLLEVRR